MSNIADTMVELLLFPLNDPRWVKIFHDQEQIGGAPRIEKTNGRAVFYFLPKLGVQLNTDGKSVLVIDFYIAPQGTADLPFGLKHSFNIANVHKLLGTPISSNPPDSQGFSSERYLIGPYRVFISYLADRTLHLISIYRTSET